MHLRVGTHHLTYPTILNNAVPEVKRMAFAKNAHHVNKGIVRLLIKRNPELDSLRRQRWPALKHFHDRLYNGGSRRGVCSVFNSF